MNSRSTLSAWIVVQPHALACIVMQGQAPTCSGHTSARVLPVQSSNTRIPAATVAAERLVCALACEGDARSQLANAPFPQDILADFYKTSPVDPTRHICRRLAQREQLPGCHMAATQRGE